MSIFTDFNISESGNASAPNEDVGDATAATLTVTNPDGTETVLDLFTAATFPKTDKAIEFSINMGDLGGTTDAKFQDGVWTFLYTVTMPIQGTITNTQTVLLSGNARCCVYGLLASVDACGCDCDGSEMKQALEAHTYYRAALACAATGDITKFECLLDIISKYCNGC
jgi:hypothetical protein